MEFREIEIFLALSEELHFGRTAERLHLTQGRVSQSIRRTESRVGGTLFDRSSRRVELTPLGEQLRDDLSSIHTELQQSIDRAKLAAKGHTEVLRLGMLSWNTEDVRPALDAFAATRPECEIQLRTIGFGDPFGPLRTGAVDAAILWLPVREPDLTVGPVVFIDTLALAVSTNDPVAQRESVTLEDLGDLVVLGGCVPQYWREAVTPTFTPSGRRIEIGPVVSTFAEMIPIISNGEAVSPMHAHGRKLAPHPDLTYLPISDAPPAPFALIWRTATASAAIHTLAEVVQRIGPQILR